MTNSVEDLKQQGWQLAAKSSEIKAGDKMEVELESGDIILLLGTDEGIAAICADCPHQDTPLEDGDFDGTVITCPLHFWQWNVKTGEPIGIAEMPLPKYKVTELDGDVFVRIN